MSSHPVRSASPAIPGLPFLRGIAGTRRRWLVVIAAAGALLVTAATLVTFRLAAGPRTDPALAGLIREVTTVPVGKSLPGLPGLSASASPAGAYSSMLTGAGGLTAVSGPPLTRGGKPEVLYVASGYCPYCAMENWPLIVALSRFGRFTGVDGWRSPQFEHIAPVDSWTFYGSRYASPYLSFVAVEEYSNVLVTPRPTRTRARATASCNSSRRPSRPCSPGMTRPGRPVPGLRQPGCPDRLGSHSRAADDRQVVAAAGRHPPAARYRPRLSPAHRGGLTHRRTVPSHRRPPRPRLPGTYHQHPAAS